MTEGNRDLATRPAACPFVALDDDRDRRSDAPDDRHRCYADPTPQTRALAHQEAYCLSAGFSDCPIFLDWATRAAADPITASRETPGIERLSYPVDASASVDVRPAVDASAPIDMTAAAGARPPAPTSGATREPTSPGWATPPPWRTGQLSAFPDESDGPDGASLTVPDGAPFTVHDPGVPHPPGPPMPAARRSVVARPPYPVDRSSVLAGRPSVPASRPTRQAHPAPMEEDQEPEWSRPRRFEPYAGSLRRRRISLSPILLGLIGLAVAAAVLFALPGFLSGVGAPTRAPSTAAAITPSPSPTPTPGPTPVTYEVEPGDTMERIARMFALTIDQIACANAIEDVDRLSIGQVLIIPDDDFECADSSGAASPSD